MPINMISLSLKRARVRTILWFVFSTVLLANMAGVPFATSIVYASSIETSQSSANSSNPIFSDINDDGVVNILDLNVLALAFNSYPGHPNWNSEADLNDDDVVDLFDLELLMKDFGTCVSMKYFPLYGQGDFELFPFSKGTRSSGYDWDWVNGRQVFADDTPTTSIYVKQSTVHVQHGSYSAEFHIGASSETQHCKLYEREQDRYQESYWGASQPEAYYSAWFWFPADFAQTFGQHDWRLIMQWADMEAGSYGAFPTLALVFQGYGDNPLMLVNHGWYTGKGRVLRHTGYNIHTIPKERWVHIEAYAKMSSGFRVLDGHFTLWVDGQEVLDRTDIALWNYYSSSNKGVCWGIGNYGKAVRPSSVWIDNVQVTSNPSGNTASKTVSDRQIELLTSHDSGVL